MTYSKALIVDDSKLARITLKKKLEARGLEIVMAEDASIALTLLETESVDLVFMDHLMPGMDGFEATQAIKGNPKTQHLPVVMCSGKESEGYLEEAQAIGASNVLAKPPENEALDAVFAQLEQEAAAIVAEPAAVAEVEALEPAAPVVDMSAIESSIAESLAKMAADNESKLQSMAEQVKSVARDVEARMAASSMAIKSLEEKVDSGSMDAPEPLDVAALTAGLRDELFNRLSADLAERKSEPSAELDLTAVEASITQKLEAELLSKFEQKVQDNIAAAIANIELPAVESDSGVTIDQVLAESEDQIGTQIEAALGRVFEDKWASATAELKQSLASPDNNTDSMPDMTQFKAELMAELKDDILASLPESGAVGVNVDVHEQVATSIAIYKEELEAQIGTTRAIALIASMAGVAAIALSFIF